MFEQKSPLALWLALLLWAPATALAQAAAPLAETVPEHGLLWRIATPGTAPSYLFGTIHSGDERVLALPEAVTAALDTSRSFGMEIVLSPETVAELNRRMLLPAGESLQSLLTPAQWRELRLATAGSGASDALLRRLRPWAAVMLLSNPGGGGPTLDAALQRRAVTRGLPVFGLESVAEQVAVFEQLEQHEQLQLLAQTLADWRAIAGQVQALTRAWLARDLARLQALLRDQLERGDRVLNRRFAAGLIDQRNARMLQRMLPRLHEGGAFVAVGALHLPGEQGLLRSLQRAGFSVARVY